ncbi:MAG: dihydrofolate reductase [Bacteroidetes bacterium]|nr:MAG: dihydrofolate reductase [Bacteroidota bacterium]
MHSFQYQTEQFADIRILRYEIPGFEELSLQQKTLIYYLHEAAQSGRDIFWDQNYRHNLSIRKTLEEIIKHFNGNRDTEDFQNFLVYAKRVFVANGIHHHYSSNKIIPEFTEEYFVDLINNSPEGNFPVHGVEELNALIYMLTPIIFDPQIDAKKVNLDPNVDMAMESANNFYHNVTQEEVLEFYNQFQDPDNDRPLSWGLNSQLAKSNEIVKERIWRVGGMYSRAIEQIISWLEKALSVAENDHQRQIIGKLIVFYETGDLALFDEYSILWVQDTQSEVDFTNGFIEVYGDPFGLKGSYQSMVSIIDKASGNRTELISENAQWFEDHLPVDEAYRKPEVSGISARAINIAAVAGDNSPTPPLGVNLPNSDWIRREYGSKSVTITNIAHAYHQASLESGIIGEFACNEAETELAKKYGFMANNLHTDLHEIIGHGSGRLKPGVAEMSITLKNYASVIEEARADLAALYFMLDPMLVELGIIPSLDVGIAQYNSYIKNGLMQQLYRIEPGQNIEQTHMRNRQLIASKVMEMGKEDNVIEKTFVNGKTCFVVHNHEKLRELFGVLLHEVQRIKSEGDFEAARKLVENYGVRADQELLKEVHERYSRLGIPPYAAFINPRFIPVVRNDRIVDIRIEYPESFLDQMLFYGERYSFLPVTQ